MCRKHLSLILAIVLLISAVGCGIKNVLPSKEVPPLEGYSTIALVFFLKEPSTEYANLPTLLSYSIGTKLSVRYEDRNWIYDQSDTIMPVGGKLKELNILPEDIYQDPQKAAKLAEALQADLVIVAQTEKPKFTKEESGKIEYEMTEVTVTGAARYYAIHQTAILKSDVQLIDKATQAIWDGRIVGYKKYKTRYRTGSPQKSQRDETMLADVRKDFVANFVEKLYPVKAAEGE